MPRQAEEDKKKAEEAEILSEEKQDSNDSEDGEDDYDVQSKIYSQCKSACGQRWPQV